MPATESAATDLGGAAAGSERPQRPPAVPALTHLGRIPFAFSSVAFNAASCYIYILAGFLVCGLAVSGWLWMASRPKAVVAVESKPRQPVAEKTESQPAHPAQNQGPAPALGKTAGANGSRPAQSATSVVAPAQIIGTGPIVGSGARQFVYRTGTKVALQGPFKFGPTSADSGALFYGKSTIYVTTDSPFRLKMPNLMLICAGGEFGVDIDRSGNGWIQVFRGGMTLWLPSSEVLETTGKIALAENESVCIRQRDGGGGGIATVIHDASLAASLASRMPPRWPRQDGGKKPSPATLAQETRRNRAARQRRRRGRGTRHALDVRADVDGNQPLRRRRADERHSHRPLHFVGTGTAPSWRIWCRAGVRCKCGLSRADLWFTRCA